MLQEFISLDDDASIYKLVGPVLLKQDRNEAIGVVSGRLDYINKEMYKALQFSPLSRVTIDSLRIEKQIKESQESATKTKVEVS